LHFNQNLFNLYTDIGLTYIQASGTIKIRFLMAVVREKAVYGTLKAPRLFF